MIETEIERISGEWPSQSKKCQGRRWEIDCRYCHKALGSYDIPGLGRTQATFRPCWSHAREKRRTQETRAVHTIGPGFNTSCFTSTWLHLNQWRKTTWCRHLREGHSSEPCSARKCYSSFAQQCQPIYCTVWVIVTEDIQRDSEVLQKGWICN